MKEKSIYRVTCEECHWQEEGYRPCLKCSGCGSDRILTDKLIGKEWKPYPDAPHQNK